MIIESEQYSGIAKKSVILITAFQSLFYTSGLYIDSYIYDDDGVALPYRWRARDKRFEIIDRRGEELVWVTAVDVNDMEKVSDLLKVVDMLYDAGVKELKRVSIALEESYEIASGFYTRISGE
jgi:hypothetical protein